MIDEAIPTSSFEQLMLAQDSEQFPCVFYFRFRFTGTVRRSLLEQALRTTLLRHPLLRARISLVRNKPVWTFDQPPESAIQWRTSANESNEWLDSRIDITCDQGFAIEAVEGDNKLDLIFEIQHSCADGLGILNAIHEIMLSYNSACKNCIAELPELDKRLIRNRNRFGLNTIRLMRWLPRLSIGLLGVRQFLMRNPVQLVPHEPYANQSSTTQTITTVGVSFGPEKNLRLQAAARKLNVTSNELLTSAIFHSVSKFRSARGMQSDADWLRVMVPVSLRSNADKLQTACNIVSCIFLDRTPRQISDPDALVKGIHDEMELIKRNRLALWFIFSLWMRKIASRGAIPSTVSKRCPTTLVFTNMGRVFDDSELIDESGKIRAGDLHLESIDPVAPLTPHMCAAFSAIRYADQLQFILRFDPRVLTHDDASVIMNNACQWLQDIVEIHADELQNVKLNRDVKQGVA